VTVLPAPVTTIWSSRSARGRAVEIEEQIGCRAEGQVAINGKRRGRAVAAGRKTAIEGYRAAGQFDASRGRHAGVVGLRAAGAYIAVELHALAPVTLKLPLSVTAASVRLPLPESVMLVSGVMEPIAAPESETVCPTQRKVRATVDRAQSSEGEGSTGGRERLVGAKHNGHVHGLGRCRVVHDSVVHGDRVPDQYERAGATIRIRFLRELARFSLLCGLRRVEPANSTISPLPGEPELPCQFAAVVQSAFTRLCPTQTHVVRLRTRATLVFAGLTPDA